MNEFVKELKVGDRVILTSHNVRYVKSVTRTTKTMVMVGRYRFRKNTGWQVGDYYYHSTIRECTPELVAELAVERKIRKSLSIVRGYNFSVMSVDELQSVVDIIEGVKV